MTTFGPAIPTDGKCPDWFWRMSNWEWRTNADPTWRHSGAVDWKAISAVRLPDDHPYYLVLQYPGMKRHIGYRRPDDFDPSKPVLFRDGYCSNYCWDEWNWSEDGETTVIGYYPLTASPIAEQGKHASHKTRSSDASSYDEVCTVCGATDISGGGWGKLALPCTTSQADDVPQWAIEEAKALARAHGGDMRMACARLIAQHETPPVDEATELWEQCLVAYHGGANPKAVLRNHLAKVRGGVMAVSTASEAASVSHSIEMATFGIRVAHPLLKRCTGLKIG